MSKIEDEVCEKIQARTKVGLEKYGVTMEREDFTHLDWLIYLQEELMDGVVYLQRLMTREQTLEAKLRELVESFQTEKTDMWEIIKKIQTFLDEVSE